MDFVRIGYFIPLNGPLNGHPPRTYAASKPYLLIQMQHPSHTSLPSKSYQLIQLQHPTHTKESKCSIQTITTYPIAASQPYTSNAILSNYIIKPYQLRPFPIAAPSPNKLIPSNCSIKAYQLIQLLHPGHTRWATVS